MYEYHLHGVEDGDGPPFTFTGITSDFLEVCCQIVRCYDELIAGYFITALFEEHGDKLDFLRITDWNFKYEVDGTEKRIILNKTI